MSDYKKIYAPELMLYERHFSSSRLNENTNLTEQSGKIYETILENIQRIKPTFPERNLWKLWFKSDRGSLDDFGNYDELHEGGVYDTYEQFVEEYESYDKAEYWFKLRVQIDGEYSALAINNSRIVSIDSRENCGFLMDMDELLAFLNNELNKIIDMVETGVYNDYLNNNLPYEYRHGAIQRKRLWEFAPDYRNYDLGILTQDDVVKFLNMCNNSELQPNERISEMTAGKYYEFCSYCYRAALYEDLDGKKPKQMFERYGDNRDGGLSKLDENSAEDFNKWFGLDWKEKWEIENPSHMWELRQGSSRTRIHLSAVKDDDGYYITLSGRNSYMTDELIKMYIALKEHNVPVVFYGIDEAKEKVLGLDQIGVIAEYEDSCSYTYGGFEESKILNFVHVEDVPEENREEFIKAVDWFPLAQVDKAS